MSNEAKFESKEMSILGTFVIFRNGQHIGTKEAAEIMNELYEALEEILTGFTPEHLDSISGTGCGTRAKAALAKAKGE